MKKGQKTILKLIIAVLFFFLCFGQCKQIKDAFLTASPHVPDFILDAGHGGEDGGAVSISGNKESNFNLDITLKLDQILGLLGRSSLLLREQDISLHNESAVTLREKKISDLKNRTDTVRNTPDATLVSIHQNSYPEPKYQGTQVFYAPTGGSQQLAREVQNAVIQHIQPSNNRREKQIDDNVYLMNHIENRAILIECGFLTNPDEEKKLLQPDYQRMLALTIASSLAEVTKT